MKPKIIVWDVETAPEIGASFGRYDTNLLWILQPSYMLCFCYKELGKKSVHSHSLIDYKGYKKNHTDDKQLALALHKMFDEADILIAHNGNKFDAKWANRLFIKHGLLPPSPVVMIDTLLESRKLFKLESHRLDDLGEFFGVGRKIKHEGKDLWKKCMEKIPNMEAWNMMIKYCKQDVRLLERVYNRMLPYIKVHPNLSIYKQGDCCPRCGGTHIHVKAKREYLNAYVYQRYQCADCGKWLRGERVLKDFKPKYR